MSKEALGDLLTSIIHSNATERLVQRDFTFDGLTRLQNRTLFRANETPVVPDAFAYNSRSELTNAIYQITQSGTNAIRQFFYDFDPIGNRNSATEFGTNTSYTASALNQYTSINPINPVENFSPEFDLDGNQTLLKTTTGIWHVTYNAENRPILFSNDTTVVEMVYDYMGRRFEYKESVSGTLTRYERYLYRGYLQIAALDMLNSANVKHTIAWDTSERIATRPLALQIGTAAYYYSFDQVKNVTELFDSAGALAATYDYSPFGQVTSFQITQSGNNALTQFSNPLTFSSEVQDSTLGLQYYNYRHLNTLDGRWVNRDPIQERGGVNLNNRLNCYRLVSEGSLSLKQDMFKWTDSRRVIAFNAEKAGYAQCNEKTGNVDVTIIKESCEGNCTRKHENVHVIQQSSCCAALANACKRNPGLCNLYIEDYNRWLTENAHGFECTAYVFSVACYVNAISEMKGKQKNKCCEEMVNHFTGVILKKNMHCQSALPNTRCPSFSY